MSKPSSTHLSLLIVRQTLRVKLFDNLFGRRISLNFTLEVETDHVARIDFARQLEELDQALLLRLLQIICSHRNDKVYVNIVVMLFVVLFIILT